MEPIKEPSQELPEYMISGIRFGYDAALDEFRQNDRPENRIPMQTRWEENNWTQFFFDQRTKNIYTGGFPNGERPEGVHLVIIPSIPYLARMGIKVRSLQEKALEERSSKIKRKKGKKL